ncbi:MAG: pyruvate kinase [Acidobacteria bacterium]|nr:pyruvate kinase [Acidobacteriota bacterium]
MNLQDHKTKIVCTLGPASEDRRVLEKMLRAGMDVARLNFSHGDFESHGRMVEALRAAARNTGRRVAILADLPGPKIRIGRLAEEPIAVAPESVLTLTTDDIVGDRERISVNFSDLPKVVKGGDTLFVNDGFIQLEVLKTEGSDVRCKVVVGGELRSGKGLNFPGIRLGIGAFTDNDRRCLEFALKLGVDAVSQSFVENAEDIESVRRAATEMGYSPFIVAKIERAQALEHIDSIIEAADGVMIGRGDLGVEIPIEQIAVVQKRLMRLANHAGKPVITATQMLESMTDNPRPTRAEATDVANAILDGTDCVMLSGESAMGRYPVESVSMLSRIAATTEPKIPLGFGRNSVGTFNRNVAVHPKDLIALSLEHMMDHVSPAALLVPTQSGATARNMARFRLPVWITAVSSREQTCQILQFSYGVFPVYEPEPPKDWQQYSQSWLQSNRLRGDLVLLIEGPSPRNPTANHRLEIIDMKNQEEG